MVVLKIGIDFVCCLLRTSLNWHAYTPIIIVSGLGGERAYSTGEQHMTVWWIFRLFERSLCEAVIGWVKLTRY